MTRKVSKTQASDPETELTVSLPTQQEEGKTTTMNVTDVNWGALLDSFSGDRSPVLFLKAKLKARLLPFENAGEIFFPVDTYFRGKKRTKYLVKIWNIEDQETPIRALLITTSTVKAILNQAVEGWDLFSADKGAALILTKTGQGMKSEVSLSPSPRPVPVPADIIEAGKKLDMRKVAEEFSQRQKDKDEASSESSEEEGSATTSSTNEADW